MRRSIVIGTTLTFLSLVSLYLHLPAFQWGLPSSTQTLGTFQGDEQISFYTLAQWKPKQLKFSPGDALYWGELHLHLVAASLAAATVVGYVHPVSRAELEQNLYLADRLYRVGRGLSVAFGLVTVWFGYWIGRKLFGTPAGLALGTFCAITPLQVIATFYVRPDGPLVLEGLAVLYLSARYLESGEARDLFWAGVAAGLAAATKYTGGIFILTPVVAWLFQTQRSAKTFGMLVTGGLSGFAIGCPIVIFDFPLLADMLKRQFIGAKAFSPQSMPPLPWAIEYIRTFFHFALTHPLTVCLFGGFLWALWRGDKRDRWMACSFIVTYLVITAPRRQFVTYAVPLLPFLFILGARGVGVAWENWKRSWLAKGWLAFSLIAMGWTLIYATAYMRLFRPPDSRIESSEWMKANIPPGATILVAKNFYWTPSILRAYQSPYRVIDPTRGDPPLVDQARIIREAKADFAVLSDFEMRDTAMMPELAKALEDVVYKPGEVLASFEHHPQFGPLSWPDKTPPWDWIVPNPTITIYKLKNFGNVAP